MKLRKLGFFKELPHGDPAGPSIAVQAALPAADKERVLRYLKSGALLAASQAMANDHFTGDPITTLNLLTDGTWIWYSDLGHYLTAYDVAIDPAFLTHLKGRAEVRLSEKQLAKAEEDFFSA